MNNEQIIERKYFNWIYKLVCDDDYLSYKKLLLSLYNIEFTYEYILDGNRAKDGISFRYRFGYENGYTNEEISTYLDNKPCSVLEMMIALSFRIEEEIMINSKYGNRTGQWFWNMIVNLGLGKMDDNNFNEQYVYNVIQDFLHHQYSRDGHGSLIVIPNSQDDLRKVEIWTAFMRYLNIMGE